MGPISIKLIKLDALGYFPSIHLKLLFQLLKDKLLRNSYLLIVVNEVRLIELIGS